MARRPTAGGDRYYWTPARAVDPDFYEGACVGVGGVDYLLVTEPVRTWPAARRHCQALGSDLATIPSVEANEKLYNVWKFRHAHPYRPKAIFGAWIGLNDYAEEGTWVWADGSNSTFRYWHTGQPNNFKGEQSAAVIASWTLGKWDDTFTSGDPEHLWPPPITPKVGPEGFQNSYLCAFPAGCPGVEGEHWQREEPRVQPAPADIAEVCSAELCVASWDFPPGGAVTFTAPGVDDAVVPGVVESLTACQACAPVCHAATICQVDRSVKNCAGYDACAEASYANLVEPGVERMQAELAAGAPEVEVRRLAGARHQGTWTYAPHPSVAAYGQYVYRSSMGKPCSKQLTIHLLAPEQCGFQWHSTMQYHFERTCVPDFWEGPAWLIDELNARESFLEDVCLQLSSGVGLDDPSKGYEYAKTLTGHLARELTLLYTYFSFDLALPVTSSAPHVDKTQIAVVVPGVW